MMHNIINMAAIRHQELLKEAEKRHLVEQAIAANRKVAQPAIVTTEAVLDEMGHGLMALGLVAISRQEN